MLYMWAMRVIYGRPPAGVIYNLIRRTQLKKSVKDTLASFAIRVAEDIQVRPDFYFMRFTGSIVVTELDDWEREFDDQMIQLEKWYLREYHYKNPTACAGRAFQCPYIPICGRDNYTGFIKKDVLYPELEPKEVIALSGN
jgi:hypothetical protein